MRHGSSNNRDQVIKIKQRILDALSNGKMTYADLSMKVFPHDKYPKAWNYASNGGPPGCYMALSRALREMCKSGECHDWSRGPGPGNRWISKGSDL